MGKGKGKNKKIPFFSTGENPFSPEKTPFSREQKMLSGRFFRAFPHCRKENGDQSEKDWKKT
ncbi:MAG: hypothetical protein J6A21_11570 [Lentisphaeria bacterium]|nr:hypothetical protein [Lentisphaeria bacterium]